MWLEVKRRALTVGMIVGRRGGGRPLSIRGDACDLRVTASKPSAVWFVLQLTTFNDLGDEVDRADCLIESQPDC